MGGDGPGREFYPLRVYIARYFSSVVICTLSALLEALLYLMFAKSFFMG
jgi:hypothetical protein